MYGQGQGVDVNYKEAIEWLEKAKQETQRLSLIWVSCEHGLGVDVNHKKAIEWFEKAAEQGYADAQYNLGIPYEMARAWM